MKRKKMGLMASHSLARRVDCDASCAKLFAASSCDKRIGVGRPRRRVRCPIDDGFGTRGLLAGVAAWFEGYVEGRAFGREIFRARQLARAALRMKIAAACVPAFRDNFAIAHEHGSYERIGIRESRAAARELNSSAHIFDIGFAVSRLPLLMPRIRAFARRKDVAACDFRHASSDAQDVEIGGRSTCVGLERMGDGRAASLRLASPNSRNPAKKAPETRTFQGLQALGARHAAAWCNLLSSRLYCRLRSFTESTLRFVGCNHRWGISPRPEDWYFVGRHYTAALLRCQ